MEFMKMYWPSILIVVCFIAIMAILWARGKKDTVKSIVYALVCQAEQQFGSNTGPIKWASVWSGLYGRLPWIVRLLFPPAVLEGYIEDAVQLLKHQLRNKEFNLLNYNQEVESMIKDKVSIPKK